MDREEAISVIENEIQIDVRLCTDDQVDRFQTALYMAISALRADHTGDAADMMTNADLLARAEAAEARAEKAERERDAAVFDLLRAEEAAQETNALLDDEVHPACDYSLYLAIHDSVSDIVNWERDDVWRVQKEE